MVGNGRQSGEGKRNGKKFLFLAVVVLVALMAIPALVLLATGKYRLLMKPHPAMMPVSGKGLAATPMRKESKAVHDDDIEYILQKYTVEFYLGRKRFNGNPSLLESIRIASVEILVACWRPTPKWQSASAS